MDRCGRYIIKFTNTTPYRMFVKQVFRPQIARSATRFLSNQLVLKQGLSSLTNQARRFSTISQPLNAHQSGKSKSESQSGQFKGKRIISSRQVGKWLVICGVSVMGFVVIDGVIRLKVNELNPFSSEELTDQLYDIPEHKMTQLRTIFKLERFHDLYNRGMIALFTLPGTYFAIRGKASPRTQLALTGISVLFGINLLLNSSSKFEPRDKRLSLASKLGSNYLLFYALVSSGLDILKQNKYLKNPKLAADEIAKLSNKQLMRGTRYYAIGLLVIGLLTAFNGTFVSNLRAPSISFKEPLKLNKFPRLSDFFNEKFANAEDHDDDDLIYGNLLGNPLTIKFVHRLSATLAFAASVAFFVYAKQRRAVMPIQVFKGSHGVIGFAGMQGAIGLGSVLCSTPLSVALMHQAGSMAFLGSIFILMNRVRVPPTEVRKLVNLLAQQEDRNK